MIYTINSPDFPALIALWERSVRATHTFLTTGDMPRYKDILTKQLSTYDLFCAKDEGHKIIGVAGIQKDTLELLFVEPDLMGQGIGKTLLEYVVQNFDINKTEVNKNNRSAIKFYKRNGFCAVGSYRLDGYLMLRMERK